MSAVILGQDEYMGSLLSEFIRKRVRKGISLKTKIGKGSLSYEQPGKAPPPAPPAETGPMAFVKQNPLLLAGVAGGGVLLFIMLRKGKRGR